MFYGGRLLSRLTANDQEIEDFISLRRLNRHICIVIDSDASAPRKQPNRTKRRIRREFDKGPGFAWITKGREIENYIPADILLNVVRELYPKVTSFRRKDPYDKLLEPENFKGHKVMVDKIKIANTLRNSSLPLDILDLHDKIQRIVHFIKESNYDK